MAGKPSMAASIAAHMAPAYSTFPEELAARAVSLPFWEAMTEEEMDAVLEALIRWG